MSIDPFFKYIDDNRFGISQAMRKSAVAHKEYKRFPNIDLPKPQPLTTSFSEAILNRESVRDFDHYDITLQELSTILFWSCGEMRTHETKQPIRVPLSQGGFIRRAQPSGGGKYPIETYVVMLQEKEVGRGVYHYNVRNHALEQLLLPEDTMVKLSNSRSFNDYIFKSSLLIILTFVNNRSYEKYGSLAYKLGLIEAGHIGQNCYLATHCLGLSTCGQGVMNATETSKILEINPEEEVIVYTLAVGKKRKRA